MRNSMAIPQHRKSKFKNAVDQQELSLNLNNSIGGQIIDVLDKSISDNSSRLNSNNNNINNEQEDKDHESIPGQFLVHRRKVYYDKRSLYIFDEKSKLRQRIVWLLEWKWLERFVILIIFMSSVTLASYDQLDPMNLSLRNQILQGFQYGFTVIFALEATLKIIGMGLFMHHNAYLRDGWNWLDLCIVILGLLDWIMSTSFPQMPSMKSLRTLRVLRPLRSINAVPSMKRIIRTLLLSIPKLASVALFMSFFFVVFGILGVQQFCGYTYYFCRLTPEPVNGTWAIDPDQPNLCAKDSGGLNGCNPMTWCGAPQDYGLPISIDSPDQNILINFGITTFDNLGRAILTIFQVLTLSDWDYIMYNLMNSNNIWLTAIYFIMVVVFGSWFILNLIMAVFMDSFDQIDEANNKAHVSMVDGQLINTSQQKQQTNTGANPDTSKEMSIHNQSKDGRILKDIPPLILPENITPNIQDGQQTLFLTNKIQPLVLHPEAYDKDNVMSSIRNLKDSQDYQLKLTDRKRSSSHHFLSPKALDNNQRNFINKSFEQLPGQQQDSLQNIDNLIRENSFNYHQRVNELEQNEVAMAIKKENENSLMIALQTKVKDRHIILRFFFNLCSHYVFQGLVNFAIILNTTILALDRHPMPKNESAVYDQINIVLTWFFVMEMICKVLGLGPKLYYYDKFNRFDFIIVIVSLIEMIYDLTSPESSRKGIVSAFRAFRMIRIFKLARSWKSFQIMIIKIGDTIKDVANYSILLLIMMFTYSLLGMEFFANSIKEDIQDGWNVLNGGTIDPVNGISPRTNFDTIWSSSTTVFQVLMGDGWDNIMFDYVRNSSVQAGPVIYFISLMLIGNLILIKLFSAILLKNFEDEEDDKTQHELKQEMSTSQKKVINVGKNMLHMINRFFNKKRFLSQKQKINAENSELSRSDSKIIDETKFYQSSGPQKKDFVAAQNMGEQILDNSLKTPDMGEHINFQNTQSHLVRVQTIKGQSMSLVDQENTQGPLNLGIMDIVKQVNPEKIEQEQSKDVPFDARKRTAFMKKVYSEDYVKGNFKSKKKINDLFSLVLEAKRQRDMQLNDPNYKEEEPDEEGVKNDEKENKKSIGFTEEVKNQTSDMPRETYKLDSKNTLAPKQMISMKTYKKQQDLQYRSLYLFSPSNKIRILLNFIINQKNFDNVILGVILVSSIILILENPLSDPQSTMMNVVGYIDIIITAIFCIECISKIIVQGFIFNGSNSYLRIGWNILDFFIVLISLISYILTGINLKSLKVLRLLRILRPLRMISRNEGLKLCVKSLLLAIPGIFNVLVLSLIFFFIFGIFFTNLLKGKFKRCYIDPSVLSGVGLGISSVLHKWDCLNIGAEWMEPQNNFNNVLNSIYTLFAISTTDNWAIPLYAGIDATSIDYQPQIDNNYYMALIFCAFTTFGFLFTLNLFMEVVVNTFHKEKDNVEKINMITESQKEWVNTQILSLNCRPLKKRVSTDNKLRNFCVYIVEGKYFEWFILGNIFCNTIALTLYWVNIDQSIINVLERVNYFFVAIFTVEAILKLVAYGKLYFNHGWNWFDFTIVLLAWIGIIVKMLSSVQVVATTTLIRTFRICRIFRLIKKAKALNAIFNSLVITLPALGNLGSLLLLIMYLYAILGMNLFADIKLQSNINSNVNFQSFGFSLLALFRLASGDNWQYLMYDCMLTNTITTTCDDNPTYSDYVANNMQTVGCGTPYATLYFISFTLLVTYIQLNLFLAIIIQGFSDSNKQVNYKITENEIEQFQDIWSTFDPNGSGFIKVSELPLLIDKLIHSECTLIPLRKVLDTPKEVDAFIDYLELHSCNKFQNYHFTDVLNSLCLTSLKISFNKKEEFEKVSKEMFDKFGVTIDNINEMVAILEQVGEDEQVRVCTQLKNKQVLISNKILKNVDSFDGNFYDSRHIIRMTRVQCMIKSFIQTRREKKQEQLLLEQEKNFDTAKYSSKHLQEADEKESLLKNNANSTFAQSDRNTSHHYFGIKQNSQISTNLTLQQKIGLIPPNNFINEQDQQSNALLQQYLYDKDGQIDEEYSNEESPTMKTGGREKEEQVHSNVSPLITDQLNDFMTQSKHKTINFYSQKQLHHRSSSDVDGDSNSGDKHRQNANDFQQINGEEEQDSQSLIENHDDFKKQNFNNTSEVFLDNYYNPIQQNKRVEPVRALNTQDEERGGCIDMEEEEKTNKEDLQNEHDQKMNRKRSDLSSIDEEKDNNNNGIFNYHLDISFNRDEQPGDPEQAANQDKRVRTLNNFTQQRRNDNNFESHTLNTPGRARKKHQPQQKDHKNKVPSWTGQNNQQNANVLTNQQTIVSDSSNQSRRIFFSNQPMRNVSLTNSKIKEHSNNPDDVSDNGDQAEQEQSSSSNSKIKKQPVKKAILYNLDQRQFESQGMDIDLIPPHEPPFSKFESAGGALYQDDDRQHLNVEFNKPLQIKSSENSFQLLPSYNDDNYSLSSSQERKLRKEKKQNKQSLIREEDKVQTNDQIKNQEDSGVRRSQGFDDIEIGQPIYQLQVAGKEKHNEEREMIVKGKSTNSQGQKPKGQ